MKPSRGFSRSLAWSISAVSALMIGAGLLLWATAIVQSGRFVGLPSHQATTPISGAVFAFLGGLVLSRHPRHAIGWMLAGLGLVTGVESLNLGFLTYMSLQAPGELIRAPAITHWLASWIWSPRAMIPLTLLLLYFPDGKLPTRRWRPVAWATVLTLIASAIGEALSLGSFEGLGGVVQNPFGVDAPWVRTLAYLSGGLGGVLMLICLSSVLVRFRRSRAVLRRQLKVMMYALGLLLALVVVAIALFMLLPDRDLAIELSLSIVNLTTVVISAAVGVAVLRYRLYNIDLIINRTIVYAALTVLVVASYVVVVGSLGAVFQARGSLPISLVATGLIAVLFQPVRERLQRWVNRLLYGQRDEPYSVLSQLGRRLEDPAGHGAMLAAIVETVAQTLKLPYVAIALPNQHGFEIEASFGGPHREQITLPLHYQGTSVGQLICAPRGPTQPFTEAEDHLLHDIANQVAVAVQALRLSAALQRSRQRLVTAREEERRRLRRDLHDGLGPQLASLALKLDAARNQLRQDPAVTEAILLQLRWQVQDAIGDIRRLIYDLRPPALDELGLISALRSSAVAQLASAGPRVAVEGPESLPALPAAVEVAAYRIAQEAMTNVARHANARHCTVRLDLNDGLELEVLDDGDGLPDPCRPGVGLNSMQERTAELGGQFKVERLPERGTRVVAHFPLSAGTA